MSDQNVDQARGSALVEKLKAARRNKGQIKTEPVENVPGNQGEGIDPTSTEDTPIGSDQPPVIAQATDGDADTAPVGPGEDPVVVRMRETIFKLQSKLGKAEERLQKRAEKVASTGNKSSTGKVISKKKDKLVEWLPTTVPEMFPRFPTVGAVWGLIEKAMPTEIQEGTPVTVELSINRSAKELNTTRPTAKRAVHALVEKGILVDTTPTLNSAHTYEVRVPNELFTENTAKNVASGAVKPDQREEDSPAPTSDEVNTDKGTRAEADPDAAAAQEEAAEAERLDRIEAERDSGE